jgi:oligoribonuclease
MISHDEADIRDALAANPFWAGRPSEAEQIIAEMKSGKPEDQVQADLVALINNNFDPDETVYMAGNTIRLDLSFADKWLQDFAGRLHYRMLDVSSFKLWWMAHGKPEFPKRETHRALDDIRESVAELRFYSQDIKF